MWFFFSNCEAFFHVHCLLVSGKRFFKIEKANNQFSFSYFCDLHAESLHAKIYEIQDIIAFSKQFQKENIEVLEKKNKKMAEDWLPADFFDFANDEFGNNGGNFNDNQEKSQENDLFYSEYLIKKRKLGNETSQHLSQTKENRLEISNSSEKRMKKIKKQYSPTNSPCVNERKKHHFPNNFKEKTHENNTRHEKRDKFEKNREKLEFFLKKLKSGNECKKPKEIKGQYPNFLDDNREM